MSMCLKLITLWAAALVLAVSPAHASEVAAKHASATGHSQGQGQIEIRNYRFQSNPKHAFDRLVLDLVPHSKHGEYLKPRITPSTNGKESTLQISGVTLVGAIPESELNESYSHRSKYLGPVAINTDNPTEGFSIRAFLKGHDTVLDAFWLQKPLRLVVDAYPKNSPRATDPDIASGAGHGHGATAKHTTTPHKPRAEASPGGILCFPVTSRVVASIGFKGTRAVLKEKPYYSSKEAQDINPDDVACYPATALLKPFINFNVGGDALPAVSAAKPITHSAHLTPPPAVATTPVEAPPAAAPILAQPTTPAPIQALAQPPVVVNSAPDDVFDDMDLFGPAPVTQAAKDAPPPPSQEPQRIPTSPNAFPPVSKNGLPTLPGLGGLLPPRK